MGTWRCPHCATLQVEASRCFLCNRSATSCGTCINFRRSLVGGVGYCALDARREPLTGEEQRPCWAAAVPGLSEGLFDGLGEPLPPTPAPAAPSAPGAPGAAQPAVQRRSTGGLIELEPRTGLTRRDPPAVSGT